MEKNAYIDREPKTLAAWREQLYPSEFEALLNYLDESRETELTPDDAFEAIVSWNGGIATAYQIKSIISRVYSVEL